MTIFSNLFKGPDVVDHSVFKYSTSYVDARKWPNVPVRINRLTTTEVSHGSWSRWAELSAIESLLRPGVYLDTLFPPCEPLADPRGCLNVRCQLGRKCCRIDNP